MAGNTRQHEVITTMSEINEMLLHAAAAVCHHTGRRRVWNNAGVKHYTVETSLGQHYVEKIGIYNRFTGEEYTSEQAPYVVREGRRYYIRAGRSA